MLKLDSKIKAFSVVSKETQSPPPKPAVSRHLVSVDSDRRLVLGRLPGIVARSLRYPQRPTHRDGFIAWTSDYIDSPAGGFALCISVAENRHAFEIWCLAKQEQLKAASLVCQFLSKILQTDDVAFIRHHLDALKKAREVPFQLTLPHSGQQVTALSVSAAIALVYEAHARHIGYLPDDRSNDGPSPMLSAMSSIREPKSSGAGGFASFDDVHNISSGDDFPMFLKECWVDGDNAPVPISLWFGSKHVPTESEGILKLVSLAMRHRDPAWIASFLRKMRKHVVYGQELGFAGLGGDKQSYYPSTWAYVADLVLNRYVQLGILDDQCHPVPQRQGNLFALPVAVVADKTSLHPPSSMLACPACHLQSCVMSSGCMQCTACDWSRCS